MTMKRLPNIRQFERGFHITAPTEEHPLGTFTEFEQQDEIQHRHPGTSLKFKQALVGGNIEPLHFIEFYKSELDPDHEEFFWDIYGNEDGSYQYDDGNPPTVNMRASAILGHEVFGSIIFVPRAWRDERDE